MPQEAPNIIDERPPYEQALVSQSDVIAFQWHIWFDILVKIIADLQARVTALGG